MNRERISIAWFWCLFVWPFAISAVQHPPDVNPANFTAGQAIDNAYFPQRVGTLFVYEGTTEGIPTRDEVCVTSQTRPPIEGVQVTVVHHRSYRSLRATWQRTRPRC